jgi:Ca2+-binding EF-hand superfamily protein
MAEINPDYFNELQNAFKDFDKDNNGAIATKELGSNSKALFLENILRYFN